MADQESETERAIRSEKAFSTAMVLTIGFLATLFAVLVGTLLVVRNGVQPGTSWQMPDLFTHRILALLTLVVLGIGSFMMETAQRSLKRRDWLGLRATSMNCAGKGVAALLLLGGGWYLLAGKGFVPLHSTHAFLYYLTTGLHGLALAGGIALIVPMAVRRHTPAPARLAVLSWYWHLLTLLQAVILPAFYL